MILALNFRAVAAALTLSVLVATNALAEDHTPPALQKVTVGVLYIVADSAIFIAKEKGYFAKQGIEVDLNRFTSGADQIPLLATSKLDVGTGSATPGLFNAYVRGFDIPIVSSKAIISPRTEGGNVMMVRTDLYDSGKIRSSADLRGARIAVNNIQSTMLNYVVRGVATGGLAKSDVNLVEMPFTQFIPALQKKAVDAVFPLSPLTETIADRLKLAVRLPETELSKTSANDTANMLFYSQGFMKSEAAKGFMIAFLKAKRDYQRAIFDGTGDRTEICGIIHKYLSFVPPDCSGMAMTAVDPDGSVNVRSLERYQDEWIKWGVMHEPANIRAEVNMTYVNYAIDKLGKYRK